MMQLNELIKETGVSQTVETYYHYQQRDERERNFKNESLERKLATSSTKVDKILPIKGGEKTRKLLNFPKLGYGIKFRTECVLLLHGIF